MKQLRHIIKKAFIGLWLCGGIAMADPYAVGSKVSAFTANDQHGAPFTLDTKATRYLLISFDMGTGKKANGVLDGLGKDYLPGKKAVYVANIFGMPGIGRTFALPKMKKYAHRIILGDDANLLTPFPQQPSKVTVLKLDGGKVGKISYWDPEKEGVDGFLK